jgi:uncharacterized protein
MKLFKSFAAKHPVLFVLSSIFVWLVIVIVFSGIASTMDDALIAIIGRLVVTACCLLLIWHLGWLKVSGVTLSGSWLVWLIALGGMIYFTCASLFAFYGNIDFDFSGLMRLPDARTTVMTHFAAGLSEEILFRGLVLCALSRVWGNTKRGVIGSVVLTSLLFAILHITQVFTSGVSLSSALLLALETFVISLWWGALVLFGGSIWPAVILHCVGNAVVAVQGLTVAMVEPDILAYERILWFSLLLGGVGIGLLAQTLRHPRVSFEQGELS